MGSPHHFGDVCWCGRRHAIRPTKRRNLASGASVAVAAEPAEPDLRALLTAVQGIPLALMVDIAANLSANSIYTDDLRTALRFAQAARAVLPGLLACDRPQPPQAGEPIGGER